MWPGASAMHARTLNPKIYCGTLASQSTGDLLERINLHKTIKSKIYEIAVQS